MNARLDSTEVRMSAGVRRSFTALRALLCAAMVLAPWPAWAVVSGVVAPREAVNAPVRVAPIAATRLDAGSNPAFGATAGVPLRSFSAAAALRPLQGAASMPVSASPAEGRTVAQAAPVPAGLASALPRASLVAPAGPVRGPAPDTTEAEVRGKTIVLVGTKNSRPFIMREAARVARELGLNLVLVDDPNNRSETAAFVPDSHFIPADIDTRNRGEMDRIADAVAAHPIAGKAHAVVGFMSLYASLTGKITDRVGALGIPGDVVDAADHKPEARRRLNQIPGQEVGERDINTEEDARRAYRELSQGGKYKVAMKTRRGENSRFISLNIDSEDMAAAEFTKMDEAVKAFVARPEARHTTFNEHPGLMMEEMIRKLPGTEETSVEMVMRRGKAIFGMVSDTRGIGPNGKLTGGLLIFPSQEPAEENAALVAAAEKALAALGLVDGNARLDMMMTADGPRVVEINPLMGSVAIWQAVKSLTGMSLVEQGIRAVLGLPVDPGHAPDGVVHYLFTASAHGGVIEGVEGVNDAKNSPGVVLARPFVEKGDGIAAAGASTYEEWAEVIGKGKTWREAIDAAVAGARKLVLVIRKPDGTVVRQTGDYLQPTADELAPAPAPKAPGLFSKSVVGFLSTFLLISTVVESTSLAVSQMTQPLSQGFLALAALTSVSYGAYTVGSFFGGSIIKRFGIKNVYRAVLFVRAAIWTTLALLFNPATGTIALVALVPLFSLDYFFHSIGRVAEHSLQVEWFKDSEVASSRFGSFRDFIEYGTVFIGSAMALVVAAVGFGAVIYPAPVAFGIAALIALALKLPSVSTAARKPGRWSDGFKTVFRDAGIYKPLFGFALVNSFLYMMYYIVATAFGAYGAPDPQHAAAVAGSLTAVYGVGALAGSVVMDRLASSIDARISKLPEGERKALEKRLYARSAARVLPWAAAALLGSWLLTVPTQIGTLLWPIFPVSIALLAIGFTAQMASNHLDTIMKSNIPKGEKDMAVGAIRTLIYLSHVVGFLLWGGLFALFGTHAFALFALFYTGVAGLYLWLAKSLRASSSAK